MAESNESPTLNIPERALDALPGSVFMESVMDLQGALRDAAIHEEVLAGNIPSFMRTLCPVSVTCVSHCATYFVAPDYLCVGSDEDYVRVSLNPITATSIANAVGAFLPTRRMVNTIFEKASKKLVAKTMLASKKMHSTEYLLQHNKLIQGQLGDLIPGELVAGHKKDIVLCRGLWIDKNGRVWDEDHVPSVAIYGWARVINGLRWEVWQGLNASSHDSAYQDYSHGVRLVASAVLLDGEWVCFEQVVTDPQTSGCFSDEGPLPGARYPFSD